LLLFLIKIDWSVLLSSSINLSYFSSSFLFSS